MNIQKRLDDISERLKRQQNAPPLPSAQAEVDYAEVCQRLDEIYTARAERMIEKGGAVVLSDEKIAALKPEPSANGSIDYDKIGAWMDALYIKKLAANRRKMTTPPGQPAEGSTNDLRD